MNLDAIRERSQECEKARDRSIGRELRDLALALTEARDEARVESRHWRMTYGGVGIGPKPPADTSWVRTTEAGDVPS